MWADILLVWGWLASTLVGRVIRLILVAVVVYTAIGIIVGCWSPAIKASAGRLSENGKQTIANKLDKGSLQSEPESGIIAKVSEESEVYDVSGTPLLLKEGDATKPLRISKGAMVRVLDLKKRPADDNSEGMTRVMLRNSGGNFVKGYEVYIPASKISWDKI